MNFSNVGDPVKHSKHGTGHVSKLLGRNKDDGAQIKLDSGKKVKVNYNDPASLKGWRKAKRTTESKPSSAVNRLLGKVTEAKPRPIPSGAIVAVRLDSLDSDSMTGEPELLDEIAEIDGDDPLLVRLDQLVDAVDDSLREKAALLASSLINNGFTHIYTG